MKRNLVITAVASVLVLGTIVSVKALNNPSQQASTKPNTEITAPVDTPQDTSTNPASPDSLPTAAPTQTKTSPTTLVATPPPAAPAGPVTVTAFQEIVIDPDTSDCKYTYSDGTTYTFHWKSYNPQVAFINGQWLGGSQFDGKCDGSMVGTPKT